MDVSGYVVRRKQRWVANGLPDYPLWIGALIDSAALMTGAVVVVQRTDDWLPALGLAVLAGLPWVAELWAQSSTWPAFVVLTGGSVLLLMTALPVDYEFAPFLVVLAAGHVTAVAGLARGVVVTLAGEAVVLATWWSGHLAGAEAAIWAAAVVAGLDMGFILRSQQLRLDAQAREHAVREQQAVLEERQRIAREVHDLVGHSLSVTMLHLTAARREVAEAAEGDGDVADALDALTEAEQVGRRAMADIRRTVDLLGRDGVPAPAQAAPDLGDLPALVADYQRAGLDVAWETRGRVDDVPPATALGLYRIVQESLANVAKHAPGAAARVLLDLGSDPGLLTVSSDLPRGARRNSGGSGLSGMAARADQLGARLSAGPQGRTWEVRVELPRGDDAGAAGCPLPRLTAPFRRTTAPGPA